MWEIRRTVKKGAYLYAVIPEHPKATVKGYVLEHRAIVENNLGRMLLDDEVVHHINGDKKDNRIENLSVMSRKEHSEIHAVKATPIVFECDFCGVEFKRRANQRKSVKGYKNSFCSRSCNGKFQRQQQLALRGGTADGASNSVVPGSTPG